MEAQRWEKGLLGPCAMHHPFTSQTYSPLFSIPPSSWILCKDCIIGLPYPLTNGKPWQKTGGREGRRVTVTSLWVSVPTASIRQPSPHSSYPTWLPPLALQATSSHNVSSLGVLHHPWSFPYTLPTSLQMVFVLIFPQLTQ